MAVTDVEAINAAHRALGEPGDYVLVRTGGVLRAYACDADGPYQLILGALTPLIEPGKTWVYEGGAVTTTDPDTVVGQFFSCSGVAHRSTEAYIIPADA